MKFKSISLMAAALLAFFLVSCKDIKTTPEGLRYKFFKRNNGAKPKDSDFVKIYLTVRSTKPDSLVFNSRERSPEPMIIPVAKPYFKGDPFSGLKLMSEGDSAMFLVLSDTLRKYQRLPDFITKGSDLQYYIKLVHIMTKDEVSEAKKEAEARMEQQKAQQDEMMKAMDQEKITDSTSIAKYIKDNHLNPQKTPGGVYYIIEKKGTGGIPTFGDSVFVNYKGTLLDGTVFDQSKGKPLSFRLGVRRVIPGWDDAFAILPKGTKAKLIIPSLMAYGPQASGPIPAGSPLVFEVEVVNFKTSTEPPAAPGGGY
jgi:FKBP-type peptidyl-prolyl cis-trans isomerase